MKKINKKYYSAQEIKEMVLKENRLPKTTNTKNVKYSFISKVRGSIYGESGGKHEVR